MDKWNKRKNEYNKFFKLSNNQFLLITFSFKKEFNIWYMTIVVSDSKRKCNDCLRKTELSPKILYGKSTGKKIGLEALIICKNQLLEFEKKIKNTQINIVGASDRLNNVYKYLKRYGYLEYKYNRFNKECCLMYKKIK